MRGGGARFRCPIGSGRTWWPSNGRCRPIRRSSAIFRSRWRALPWGELYEVVVGAAGPTLEQSTYLDTFRGGNLADDMQSVHFSMVFRHPERTLTGEEVERAVRSVVEACERRFSAKLRT